MTIRTEIPEYTVTNGRRTVNFAEGAVRNHRIDVLDENDAPETMTAWDLAYVWRNPAGTLIFAKTTAVNDGVTIGNSGAGGGTNDRATVVIDRVDTLGLPSGKYDWALWRTDDANDDPLAEGTLVLVGVAAQPPEGP